MDLFMLGANIKMYREKAGVTAVQAAQEIKLTEKNYLLLEKGLYEPSVIMLFQLSLFFGVTASELVDAK
jgi:DNA-binding XRE family transcriptional regulator